MKKYIALLLALVMALSLVACGGNNDDAGKQPSEPSNPSNPSEPSNPGSNDPGTTPDDGGTYTDYSKGFPEQVTIQIPVYDRALEGWNVVDNYYTRWIQESFGDPLNVKVEYVAIPRSSEVNAYMQLIASHSAPDIIFHYDMPQAVNYWNQGAMQALDYDEFAYYAPTYWEKMKDTIQNYGSVNGEPAFIMASRADVNYQWVTVIRQDWIDQVGMSMPTNWDEYMALGKAFKDAGLGYFSFSVPTNANFFYSDLGTSVSDQDKVLYFDLNVAPLTWEPVKNYLKRQNEAYNAGIIDPEFYLSKDDAAQMANFVAGRTATYGYYLSSSHPMYATLKENQPDAKLSVVGTGFGTPEGNKPYFYANAPYGMIMGINADTTAEERAAVYMFLEWMAQPDNLFKLEHGIEGETFDYNEIGIPVHYDAANVTADSKLSGNNNKDYWCLVEEVVTYGSEEKDFEGNCNNWAAEGYEYLVEDNYNYNQENKDNGIINPFFTKNVESLSECSQELKDLWVEAATDLIRCAPADFDAKYEDWCKEYLDAGYQDVLDEKQAYFESGDYILMGSRADG